MKKTLSLLLCCLIILNLLFPLESIAKAEDTIVKNSNIFIEEKYKAALKDGTLKITKDGPKSFIIENEDSENLTIKNTEEINSKDLDAIKRKAKGAVIQVWRVC